MFDSPDLLSQLFGVSPANAAPRPSPLPPDQGGASFQGGALGSPTPVQTSSLGPPPPPPPSVMGLPQGPVANAQRSDAIQGAIDNGGGQPPLPPDAPIPDNASFAQRAAPMQGDLSNGAYDGANSQYNDFNPNLMRTSSLSGGGFDPDTNIAQPHNPGFAPPMSAPPLPPARPPMPGGPVQMADASGGVPIPQGAPPPPASAMNPSGGPPVTNTSGGLASSMGLGPNTMQVALSGLGRGLSAVGAQREGATAGQSFATGAGGGLTGSIADRTQQQQMARQQQNDLFNQKSTAFKDWMTNNLDSARAKYFDSYAAQRASGGGSNAWQNTPYGKSMALEKMLDNWETQQRLQLKAKWSAMGSTPEQIQSDLDNLAKQKESERSRRSQALGIDSDEHQRGTSQDHPFDFNKLNQQQRLDVPDGAYYKYHDPSDPKADKNGDVVKQRDWLTTPPYDGWQPPGGQGGQQAQPQAQPQPSPAQVEYQGMM